MRVRYDIQATCLTWHPPMIFRVGLNGQMLKIRSVVFFVDTYKKVLHIDSTGCSYDLSDTEGGRKVL